MKKHVLTLLLSLLFLQAYSQNLIKNPGFEDGTIPASNLIWIYALNFRDNVPHWKEGCSAEPSSGNTPDILTLGASDCRASVPASNHSTNLNPRIAGTSRYLYCGYSANAGFGESILGELTQPLTAGTYKISFYGSKIMGKNYCQYNDAIPETYPLTTPGAVIEVVLRKSSNTCSTVEPVVWTSGEVTNLGGWQLLNGSFVIDCEKAAKNYDRIEFRIKTPSNSKGYFIDDVSLEKVKMLPSIAGPATLCQGDPLSFTGSIASGTSSLAHLWEIQECNQDGTVVNTPLYNIWIAGNPGSFTFPASLNLECNKYYRIKLSPSNNVSCEWVETTKVIRINCNPTLTITTSATLPVCINDGISYNVTTSNWPVKVYNGGTLVGTFYSNPIVLYPSMNTNYTFSVSNKHLCTVTRSVFVSVKTCPIACFTIEDVISTEYEDSLYGPILVSTVCLPNVDIDGRCSTNESGYHLRISKFDQDSWTLDDLFNNWLVNQGQVSQINLNEWIQPNTFIPGQLYLVNLTVGPGWYSAEPQFFRVVHCFNKTDEKSFNTPKPGSDSIEVYPNPTTGNVVVTLQKTGSGIIEVYTLDGKLVFRDTFNESNQLSIDLSGCSNGVYMANITTDGKTINKKIVKQ